MDFLLGQEILETRNPTTKKCHQGSVAVRLRFGLLPHKAKPLPAPSITTQCAIIPTAFWMTQISMSSSAFDNTPQKKINKVTFEDQKHRERQWSAVLCV